MTKVAVGVAKTVVIGFGLMVSFSFIFHQKKESPRPLVEGFAYMG
jgi:hypothetical protein